MSNLFHRPDLAASMAQQLLRPGVLDEGLRSGLFLSGLRRIGKSTFLINDLIPALEAEGATVIYVDLWTNTAVSPATLVQAAVKKTLADMQTAGSALFGFTLDNLGQQDAVAIAEAVTSLVDQARTSVVLIVDEVQHAITTEDGNSLLHALKAARDAINPRPNTPGYFLFIGTGSHRALVSELTARRNQAFVGANSMAFPLLKADYIDHLFARLHAERIPRLPARDVAIAGFDTLGNRPEELIKAIRQLQHIPEGSDPDAMFPVIAATLRSTAADIELAKVEQIGSLAMAIFERIAAVDGDARGIFSNDAAADYTRAVGRDVRVEEIQPVVNDLLDANVIMRRGHGLYGITDPFVQEIWREKKRLEG